MTTSSRFSNLLEESLGASGIAQGCGVAKALKGLAAEDRVLVEAALVHPEVSAPALEKSLLKRDVECSEFMIKRHRQKKCACSREDN